MQFQTPDGPIGVTPARLTIAGWTGRDAGAVAHHIAELEAIGIPAPSATPLFYRVAASLLTQAGRIEVLGAESSGEAEPLLVRAGGRLWLGLGSDHTDRGLERVSVAASKQACPKPVGSALWPFEPLADRLDDLVLDSEIEEDGAWRPYQSGTLAAIRPLAELLAAAPLEEGDVLLGGTLAAIGGVRPASRFRARLEDPETGRSIALAYEAQALPVIA